jgi:antitoxin FitA
MAQVLVRGLDDEVVDRLKERAARNGRSLEAELRVVLIAMAERKPVADPLAEARKIREMFAGRQFSDSTELIREDRDR